MIDTPMSPDVQSRSANQDAVKQSLNWNEEMLQYTFQLIASTEFKPWRPNGRIKKPGYVYLVQKLAQRFPDVGLFTVERVRDKITRQKGAYANEQWAKNQLSGGGVNPTTGMVEVDAEVLAAMTPKQRDALKAKTAPEAAQFFQGTAATGAFADTAGDIPNDPKVKLESSELGTAEPMSPPPLKGAQAQTALMAQALRDLVHAEKKMLQVQEEQQKQLIELQKEAQRNWVGEASKMLEEVDVDFDKYMVLTRWWAKNKAEAQVFCETPVKFQQRMLEQQLKLAKESLE